MDPLRDSSGVIVTVDGTRRIIKPARGPRVLVLDDGNGLLFMSVLLYLREIMKAISLVKDGIHSNTEGVEPTLPCEYFDLICGSGRGGFYAVLLGYLGMSLDECRTWYLEHGRWAREPDSNLSLSSSSRHPLPFSPPPDWRRQCVGSSSQLRWRACLQTLVKERLGPVAGQSQLFVNPITGKSCKTCVLTWKTTNNLIRVHRFRSCSIGNSEKEGSAEERNCPVWKVAYIAMHAPWEYSKLTSVPTHITLGNDYAHFYTAIARGYCRTEKEAYDEMVHIWKSTDDSCFVSIESMRNEEFPYRHRVDYALSRGFGRFGIEANDTRPGPLEIRLPGSATLHRFGFRYPCQIKPEMWEAVGQVWTKFHELKLGPTEHANRFLDCAVRLLGAPCSEIGGSSSVAPVPINSSSTGAPQDRQATIPEAASDNGRIPGAGAIYDITTSNYRAVSIGETPVDEWFKRIRETNQSFFEGIKPEGSAVRVAILDTGINEQYPELQTNQIKDKWNFYPSFKEEYEDLDGHGSHVSAVLLRVAPQCELYIARVFKDTRDVNAENFAHINKALRCAINDWKVDIISMSFGFSEEPKNSEFKEVLTQEAARKGVLIFSAASNSGANDDIAFPACWRGHVFCINSTDAKGTPSRFNPTRDSKGYNFSTLGESVPGPTPDPNSKQLECQIRSGTSVATPIAAGIAVLILEFSRIRGINIRNVAKLKTFDGMATVLEDLSTDVGGYRYLRPWKIADSTQNNQKIYAGHLDYILGR